MHKRLAAPNDTMLLTLFKQAYQAGTVTRQPAATVYTPEAQSGFGTDALIYLSLFITVCCGLMTCVAFITGVVALILGWEVSSLCHNHIIYIVLVLPTIFLQPQARNKKERGQIQEAKAYTIGAIACNVVTVMTGVGAIIMVSVIMKNISNHYS